ncbi:restriction endonuclease subunit S [Vibrio sp. Vb1554]|uniref:restriction endonuclease subunit S n=1 Tax=Vibrio TaxID=662 RepID=UPI00146C73EE|nr:MULTISPECIES: restriction endonuclease subunit S [Vibrio]MDF5278809.1 restriction endonuclease subunit S [Vibrio parahaemolyticus]MDW3045774.1 restriction endonuclease subunit S [Vibrio sp. Vb1554]NMU70223.1 restriction endonuclease subunit S [Vibrio parahaemolyticus]
MVPNGWSIKTLEDLAAVERGKFSARPRNDPKYYGGKIPFVQTGDIASAKTYLSSFSQTLNEGGLKVSRLFPKNSILITIAANIGDTAITSFEVACPDSLVGIQPKQDVDCFWLNSFLETCKDELDGKATQNAQKNINLQVLKPLEILTPPYEEQRKIAQILSTWDKAIATTEKLIDTSKQQKKALMQQLLTGRKRLVNSETGKAFEGEWEEVKLSHFFDRVTEKNKGQSTNVVTISAQHGLIRQEEFFKKSVASETLDNYFILRKGQFAYNKSYSNGYPMGAIKRLNRYEDAVVTSLYICFELKNEKLASSCFMEQYFESGLLNRGLTKVAAEGGRAHGLLNVKPSDFMALSIMVPKFDEQQKIASVLTAADKEIEVLEAKLAHFKQEKKALMQQLLTGKRRVKIEEMEVA